MLSLADRLTEPRHFGLEFFDPCVALDNRAGERIIEFGKLAGELAFHLGDDGQQQIGIADHV